MDRRIGGAIGDHVLDLRRADVVDTCPMNRPMRLAPPSAGCGQSARSALMTGPGRAAPRRTRKLFAGQFSAEMSAVMPTHAEFLRTHCGANAAARPG